MTDRRRRERSLPTGYQFGDGRWRVGNVLDGPWIEWAAIMDALDEHERDLPLAVPGWNVIEGEHFPSDEERSPVIEGAR